MNRRSWLPGFIPFVNGGLPPEMRSSGSAGEIEAAMKKQIGELDCARTIQDHQH